MTVIDDEMFIELMREAGLSFEVPENGASDILEAAFGEGSTGEDTETEEPRADEDGREASRFHSLLHYIGAHRLQAVAACAAVVALAVAAAATLPSGPGQVHRAAAGSTLGPVHSSSRPSGSPVKTSSGGVWYGASNSGVSKKATTTPGALGSTSVGAYGSTSLGVYDPYTATGGVEAPADTKAAKSATSPAPLPNGEVGQSSKIEQTGSLSLAVAKGGVSHTMTALVSLATLFNGFVASSQTQAGSGTGSTGTVTLQVPVNSFTDLVKRAQGLGHTTDLSTKATDVTSKYVTLQSQITALQSTLQQYETILQKATTIGDILSVQAQINTIQTQIQQLQGQLQVLTHETTYSTLTVTVAVKGAPPPRHHHHHPHPESGLAKAWHDAVHGFVDGVEGLIRVGGPLLFVVLLAAVLILGARLGWRRYRRHAL